jgi:SAM-dependent methyltransferase
MPDLDSTTTANAVTAPPSADYFGKDLEAMDSASKYYDWMLSYFAPYIGQRFLEVGAGSGNFSERLLQLQPQSLTSVEPSASVYAPLQARLSRHDHVSTHHGCLSDKAGEWRGKFDTAFYVNVMEHVEDDAAEVRLALDCLVPGGHLLIFVPALPWLYGKADELFGHYRRYTMQSLTALVGGLPVTVQASRYFDILGVVPWWVAFVLLQRPVMSPRMVWLYDRMVVPIARRMEALVQPPIGKNLLLVVRKHG